VAQVTDDGCLAGLETEQARKLCPPDIEVACHNGPNFCTLSGPAESDEVCEDTAGTGCVCKGGELWQHCIITASI